MNQKGRIYICRDTLYGGWHSDPLPNLRAVAMNEISQELRAWADRVDSDLPDTEFCCLVVAGKKGMSAVACFGKKVPVHDAAIDLFACGIRELLAKKYQEMN